MSTVQTSAKAGVTTTPVQNPTVSEQNGPKNPETARANGSEQPAATLQVLEAPQPKDVARALERLEEATQVAEIRASFKKKLEEVEGFRRGVDGSSLRATVTNVNGDEIELLRHAAIVVFIDGEIEEGKKHLAKLDAQLCQYVA